MAIVEARNRAAWLTRVFACTAAAWLLPATQVATIAQDRPVFRSGRDIVRVYATVTDRDGRLVTTLGRDDFEIRDDGKPQPVIAFDNTPTPIRLIVMVDTSGTMYGNADLLREAAGELFTRLRPDDLARVGTFGHTISLSPTFTRDPLALRAALPKSIEATAPTPLLAALDEALRVFDSPQGQERPVILILSDGRNNVGPAGPRTTLNEVIDRAQRNDVMVYAVGLRSRVSTASTSISESPWRTLDDGEPDPGMKRLAEATGGGYVEIDRRQDLAAEFARIADELHGQYLLGYAPPREDGRVHRIEAKAIPRGMRVRARKEYVAPRAAQN